MTPLHIVTQSNKGFSLVELMVAILLLVVGVLAALSMVSTAIKHNTLANRLSVKTALGQQVMEELLSKKVDDPLVNTSNSNAPYDLNGSAVPGNNVSVPGAGTFIATYSVTPNTPMVGISKIEVQIRMSSALKNDTPLSQSCYKRVQ